MSMQPKFLWRRASAVLAFVIVFFLAGYAGLFWYQPRASDQMRLGVSFSEPHSQWLGLNWREAYTAVLDDLHVRDLRLAAYWNWIEWPDQQWHFEGIDWQMDEAAKRGATVTLAIGRRLPRWPECHVPDWAKALPEQQQREQVLAYIRAVVERYRNHPALRMWQVENEPLLSVFGECPPPDRAFTEREIALVQSLDKVHPILVTDSGELSLWMRTAAMGDYLGTTMYRVVWNRLVGYWSYDRIIPPAFYRLKAFLAGKRADRMIISELQAEPWVPRGSLFDLPLAEQRRSMDADRLRAHVTFARQTGFSEAILWGAEYWYWLKEKQGDPSMWDAARELFR